MLNHELRHDDEILVLNPEGPLEADDFTTKARQVDPYLEQHAKLRGVLIRAKSFPSWIDFGARLAPLKFLKQRIQKIANYFVHAQVQHFDFEREDQVWTWLRQATRRRQAQVLRAPDLFSLHHKAARDRTVSPIL